MALRWATVGWRIYDIALLGFAFGHGLLGLRAVVNDYVTNPRWNRGLLLGSVASRVVATARCPVMTVRGR